MYATPHRVKDVVVAAATNVDADAVVQMHQSGVLATREKYCAEVAQSIAACNNQPTASC